MTEVAFVGLGAMGSRMAMNLHKAGFAQLATDLDRPAPLASLVRSQYQAARRAALGKLDSCAIFLEVSGEHAPRSDPGPAAKP